MAKLFGESSFTESSNFKGDPVDFTEGLELPEPKSYVKSTLIHKTLLENVFILSGIRSYVLDFNVRIGSLTWYVLG